MTTTGRPPDDVALFGGYEPPVPAPDSGVSADRRRTLRQHAQVSAGVHPLTGGILHPDASRDAAPGNQGDGGPTCGDCRWRHLAGFRRYPKCLLPDPATGRTERVTAGPATDVRAWWPACPAHQPYPRGRRRGPLPITPDLEEEPHP